MKYTGTIKKVYMVTPEGWAAFSIAVDGAGTLRAAGQCPMAKKNARVDLEAELVIDKKYGEQLKVSGAATHIDAGIAGIRSYLASGLIRGVGDITADRIIKAFGKNALDVIANEPDRLASVKGISRAKASKISASYNESRQYMALFELFQGGITRGQAAKLLTAYGKDAVSKIRENPYRLIEDVDGFGFRRADDMAKASGVPETAGSRIRAGIVFALDSASDFGDCYLSHDELADAALDVLLPVPKLFADARSQKTAADMMAAGNVPACGADKMTDAVHYVTQRPVFISLIADGIGQAVGDGVLIDDDGRIYYERMYKTEKDCADMVAALAEEKPIASVSDEAIDSAIAEAEAANGFSFAEAQRRAVESAVRHRVNVITGGPGRGKTTIINAIISAWKKACPYNVVLCAPTGKAAKRMTETTGEKAYTIHMLIALDLDLRNTLLIVDESSMLDVQLAKKLLKSALKAQIVFVGDADQLPPIGPGLFFRDVINSGKIPCVRLSEGFRSHGLIAQNSEAILDGRFAFDYGPDFEEILAEKEEIVEKVLDVYDEERSLYGADEVCVLAPMRKFSYGVAAINDAIRETYNKEGKALDGSPYRVGDRIMQTRNNYQMEYTDADGCEGKGVFNGECGFISGIVDEETYQIRFDDGRVCEYAPIDMEDITLAYALTIHKSQGSEYKSVILIVSSAHYYMLNRSLVYTAMTRAKAHLVLICDKKALRRAAVNNAEKKRNTQLKERIRTYDSSAADAYHLPAPEPAAKPSPLPARRSAAERKTPAAPAKARRGVGHKESNTIKAKSSSTERRKCMSELIYGYSPEQIMVFDTETTGTYPEFDEILQFSACDGNGMPLLNTYIKPMRMKEWPEAQAVNGISPDMVKDAPSFDEVREQVQALFDNALLLISYNGAFDMAFLQQAGIDTKLTGKGNYDVMKEFAPIYGEWNDYFNDYKWQKLGTAAAYYGFDWSSTGFSAHDSMADVLATLYVFKKMTAQEV